MLIRASILLRMVLHECIAVALEVKHHDMRTIFMSYVCLVAI